MVSAYIALGFYLGSPIITADEKLIEKIQLPQLIHIKNL